MARKTRTDACGYTIGQCFPREPLDLHVNPPVQVILPNDLQTGKCFDGGLIVATRNAEVHAYLSTADVSFPGSGRAQNRTKPGSLGHLRLDAL